MNSNIGYHFNAIINEFKVWIEQKNVYFKAGIILIIISIICFILHGIIS